MSHGRHSAACNFARLRFSWLSRTSHAIVKQTALCAASIGTVFALSQNWTARPAAAAASTVAPLQEFVNNGDYNLSNVSGGPPIAGDPGVLSFGGTIHVFGVSGFGSLMEYVPDNAWGRIWNAYNQTLDANGAPIISQPDPVAIGGVMHVYGESANGDLVEYVSDGANGRVWNSYDITQAAHRPAN